MISPGLPYKGVIVTILNQHLSRRVIADLRKRSFVGIFIYTVALGVVLFGGGYYQRHPAFSNQFLICITLICALRLFHRLIESRLDSQMQQINIWLFLAGISCTALIWGIGSAVFMTQPNEMEIQLLMVVCTVGICAGGCVAYSPYLWLSAGFNLFILWPSILVMLTVAPNVPLALLFIMFSIYMALMSVRINAEYRSAMENEALLEEKTKDLEKISNLDGLTGIYNRRYFDTALDIAWQAAVRNRLRLSLLICDIDHFKLVNDEFGHLAGDEYLRTVAHSLKQVFRRQTDIVARYGGEEFVVLMSNADAGCARNLAEQFRAGMEETRLRYDTFDIQATVSLGVAEMIPSPDEQKEELIARADALLYRAKHNGRNQVGVFPA